MRGGVANVNTFARQAVVVACLGLLLSATVRETHAQARRPGGEPPVYLQGKADQAEGRKILEEFRKTGWGLGGGYYLEFELRVRPLKGDERVVPGRLWGGSNAHGPVSRVVLQPGVKGAERRLLVQVGAESAVWSWADDKGGVAAVGATAWFAPLGGTDLTAFDLQMPFLWWDDFTFEGVAPGAETRPANVFLLRPPAALAALRPELTGVRVWLDTQFNALAKAVELGKDGVPLKSIAVLDLQKIDLLTAGKKTGEQWIVKAIDLRDDITRNKTQFAVTGAALGLTFPAAQFEPARLADAIAPPPADRVQQIAP